MKTAFTPDIPSSASVPRASAPGAASWKWGILLFVLAILPFLPAINGEFTWDDDQWLVNNAAVHAWNGLGLIWNPFLQSLHFYPVTFTLLWLEHKIWALNPLGYHVSNMLTHAGGTVFLWLCLRRLKLKGAWLAALVWAVHPVQAESVSWVAEIKNTLSGFFYFAAFWAYLCFERIGDESENDEPAAPLRRRWGFYAAALICFVVALLAKTVVCTLPAALVLILWWQRRRLSLRMLLPIVPLLIVGLSIAAWSARQESADLVVGGADALFFTRLERCIIAGKDFWFYLRTLVVPFPLMPIYPCWTYATGDILNFLPLFAAFLLAGVLGMIRKTTGWWPLVGLLFFVGTLLPALGFFNFFTMHYTFVADHYQYLACAGIIVPLVELGVRKLDSFAAARVAAAFICLVMMTTTAFYASRFQTNFQLWSWNVAWNPAAFTAQHNLAIAYFNRGDESTGNQHLDIALEEQPQDDNIQRSVGKRSLAQGDYAGALVHFQRAQEERPHYGITYMLIGDTYLRMGRLPDALAAYEKSISVDGNDSQYYVAYAAALKKDRQFDRAADAYSTALRLSPGNMITRYNYANLLLDMNKPTEAIEQYLFILKYQENSALVWHNLAAAYYQAHQMDQALAAKQRADALDAAASGAQSGSATRVAP
jgi:protein O-mannosyl-transferase